jgi:iron complex outermembrane receptor protein
VNYEVGARGQPARYLSYSVALFLGRVTDAIVQEEEVGGRAFFRNAQETHNDGAEFGVNLTPVPELTLNAAYTYARYRFVEEPEGFGLDGNKLPGVPEHFWRFGLRTGWSGLYLDADHTLSSSVASDDVNSPEGIVDSWGAGVTNLRVGWQGEVGVVLLSPFVGVNNLWDRRYVGSVTLNGLFGRVFEPAPRRVLYVGTELGYRAR